VIGGAFHVHPYTTKIFSDDTSFLVHSNLLNASSVFIVLVVAYLSYNRRGVQADPVGMALADSHGTTLKIFPLIVMIAAVGVGLKFLLFPIAENLLLRGLVGKLYFIIPSCFLLLGMLWRSNGWILNLIGSCILIFDVFSGVIGFSKQQIVLPILVLVIGIWLAGRSVKNILMSLVIVVFIFAFINPIITAGRAHIDYDPGGNSPSTRMAILADVGRAYFDAKVKSLTIADSRIVTLDLEARNTFPERVRSIGRRFDVAPIQGYLVNEYNNGRPGRSMDGFWAVFIPRLFWPEKPIITRWGQELYRKYFKHYGATSSSLAPTYSAEAYWNYGPVGVVLVSIYLGLALGWFTRCSQLAMRGRDPAFFLIAAPVAFWACFVEAWVVATYLGEFIIFVVIFFAARAGLILSGYVKAPEVISRILPKFKWLSS